ncbi:putative transcription factor bHLH family [Helianthus annuus]|nr:putative transcription factor bHLH family [Helianthus annuus]
MTQCVPSWDVQDNSSNGSRLKVAFSNSMPSNLDVPTLDYEVAELTWKNGQLAMHGLGPPRLVYKSQAWDKPRAAETLEAIVDQATLQPQHKSPTDLFVDDLVPWLDYHQSVSGSETFGMESSRQLTVDTRERELGVKGLTSTSMGSPDDTVSGKRSFKSMSPDEHDSVCHSRPQKNESEEKKKAKLGKSSSVTTKRSRAAAIHNQSERRRRDKINEKMKTLQKLVPNANKTDKASMLDEVIEYLKQLQAQIHMMGRMNMSPMMMPLAMQQLQMAMMNPMGMGMGMGMGMPGVMDLNAISGSHPNIPGMPPVFHPSTLMQPMMASWDMHTNGDRVQNPNDPMAALLANQTQPMTMENYSRMAAFFQHMQNQPCYSSGLKN